MSHRSRKRRLYMALSLSALCLAGGILALPHWFSSEGFSPRVIAIAKETAPSCPLTPEEEQLVLKALDQPYTYLACGNQAFAFESADHRYVLKVLKNRLFRPKRFWDAKEKWRRQNKWMRDRASYQIAFDRLREETALLCVHLERSDHLPADLTLTDGQGRAHRVNPNQIYFILQKKAELIYPTLDRLMADGQVDAAKAALHSLLTLLKQRAAKGIADSPPDIDKNFGFIDGKAVQIDIGRFTDRPMPTRYRDRHKHPGEAWAHVPPPALKPSFTEWLARYPELLAEINSYPEEEEEFNSEITSSV